MYVSMFACAYVSGHVYLIVPGFNCAAVDMHNAVYGDEQQHGETKEK